MFGHIANVGEKVAFYLNNCYMHIALRRMLGSHEYILCSPFRANVHNSSLIYLLRIARLSRVV